MFSSIVGMVGEMYYVEPMKKFNDDFEDSLEYGLVDDTYGATSYPETLERKTTLSSGHSYLYEIITLISNRGPTKASYESENYVQERRDTGYIENSSREVRKFDVVETATSVVDTNILTGKLN